MLAIARSAISRFFPVILALTIGTATANSVFADDSGFILKTAQKGNQSIPYAVYVPSNWSKDQSWPVVLYLHGAADKGTDGWKQTHGSIGDAIRNHPERFPAIVVFPQIPKGTNWRPDQNPINAELALQALDESIEAYNGDPNRIYLTGISLGGNGTWIIGAQNAKKFAALMPMAGYWSPGCDAPLMKDLPIWVFHGGADTTINVQQSRNMVNALRAAGDNQVKYTEYAGMNHDVWDTAWNDPAVPAWLFDQVRP